MLAAGSPRHVSRSPDRKRTVMALSSHFLRQVFEFIDATLGQHVSLRGAGTDGGDESVLLQPVTD